MKKIFSNIRTMAALLMAGAAFAACSSSDDIIENQQPANNGKQAYTLTISAITGNTITVSEAQANFVNQTAVVVLKPYNYDWSRYVGLTSLIVSVTMNNVPEAGTVTEHLGPFTLSGDQPDQLYYFALPSQASLAKTLAAKYSLAEDAVSALLASATITFTGHQIDILYLTCSKTGYKFAAGKYYKLDQNNFVMRCLYKYAAAGKKVYTLDEDGSWSKTVTFAVNSQNGWRIEGDDVYCGDQQLYFNSEPVHSADDFMPWGATSYSLVTPAAGPTAYTLAESTHGMIVGTDGKAYDVNDKDNLPTGVTAAGVVVYKDGAHDLAIALTDEASTMNWDTANGANGAAAHTPAVSGYSWVLPSQNQWNTMFSANGGLNTALATAGGEALTNYDYYWSSSEIETSAYNMFHYDGNVSFMLDDKSYTYLVRACLAF